MNTDTTTSEEKNSAGAIVSIIVIVVILAVGAYYFLRQVPPIAEETSELKTEAQEDVVVSSLSKQSTSTDLTDIKKDLDATNLSNLDAGLSNLAI